MKADFKIYEQITPSIKVTCGERPFWAFLSLAFVHRFEYIYQTAVINFDIVYSFIYTIFMTNFI